MCLSLIGWSTFVNLRACEVELHLLSRCARFPTVVLYDGGHVPE
jgi:hypothetical protein